jgi:hypothetical protein
VITFASGSVRAKKWKDARTMVPVRRETIDGYNHNGNPDIDWLRENMTSLP